MKKTLTLIGLLFFGLVSISSGRAEEDCAEILCFDPCSQQKIIFIGDRCSVTWNESGKCFTAYAECKNSKKCLGVSCYDGCKDKYHYFKTGNSCEPVFDPAGLCWTVVPSCK